MEDKNLSLVPSSQVAKTTQGVARIGTMEVMPIENLKASFALVQTLIKEIFVKDTHYGTIPGTKKPSMYKPGADVVCTAMKCRPEYVDIEKDLGNGHREVVSKCKLFHIITGEYIGEGGGSCSTMESRYRYRKTYEDTGTFVPKAYFDAMRANKFQEADAMKPSKKHEAKKNEAGKWTWHIAVGLEENKDLADVWNTILKMSHKRSKVDAVISAFGLAGIFDQDTEDLPDYLKEGAIEAEFSFGGEGGSEGPKGFSDEERANIQGEFYSALEIVIDEEFGKYDFPVGIFDAYAEATAKAQGKQTWEIMKLAAASPENTRGFISALIKNKKIKEKTFPGDDQAKRSPRQRKTAGTTSPEPEAPSGTAAAPANKPESDLQREKTVTEKEAYDIGQLVRQLPGTNHYAEFFKAMDIVNISSLPASKKNEALVWIHDKARQEGIELFVSRGCEDPRTQTQEMF